MFHSMKSTLLFVLLVASAAAQQPTFETRKITDNVYVFRYGGYQSMFVVTPEGVIATDPIAYLRPQAAQTYLDEIRKITRAPIKQAVMFRDMPDGYLPDWFDSLDRVLALDFTMLIPGHPGP